MLEQTYTSPDAPPTLAWKGRFIKWRFTSQCAMPLGRAVRTRCGCRLRSWRTTSSGLGALHTSPQEDKPPALRGEILQPEVKLQSHGPLQWTCFFPKMVLCSPAPRPRLSVYEREHRPNTLVSVISTIDDLDVFRRPLGQKSRL